MSALTFNIRTHSTASRRDRLQQISWTAAAILVLSGLATAPASGVGLTYVDAFDDPIFNVNEFDLYEFGPNANMGSETAFNQIARSGTDNLWGRVEVVAPTTEPRGAGYSVWDAGGQGAENAPEIWQTLTGLTPSASYDVYAVYWSGGTGASNWGVRAGFSSNPGNNQWFNRTGPIPELPTPTKAGALAAGAVWDVLPPANSSGNLFEEIGNVMLLGKVGSAAATGSGTLTVYIDDLSRTAFGVNGTIGRTWFDGLAYVPAGNDVTLSASINRTTGELSFVNNTSGSFSITSYSVTSAAGGLKPGNWTPIGGGWSETSATSTNLAESGSPLALTSTAINLGAAWARSPYEDVQVSLTLADSTVVTLMPTYGGASIAFGDFNASGGLLNATDFNIMMSNMHKTLTATTKVDSHALGDITGDLKVDFEDYSAFRDAYIAQSSVAAFNAMAAGVPEPGSLALAATVLGIGVLSRRRREARRFTAVLLACFGVAALSSSAVQAQQITYVDASLENTNNAAGGDDSTWADLSDTATADNLWRFRNTFGFNGVWEATSSSTQKEDAPELVTEVSGLTNGTYYAYVFYFNGTGASTYTIRGGLSSNPNANQLFDSLAPGGANAGQPSGLSGATTGVLASTLSFDVAPPTGPNSESRLLWAGSLGLTNVTDGTLKVYVDDLPSIDLPSDHPLFNNTQQVRSWYAGIGYRQALELTLEVNTTTGATRIVNNQSVGFDVSYYEIKSASNSLNLAGWNSLDDQDGVLPAGTGWVEAGGSSSSILSEGSNTTLETFAPNDYVSLGNAFTPNATEDVEFYYAAPGGGLTLGIVQYVTSTIDTDFDDDGDTDGADFLIWQRNVSKTSGATPAQGDADGDGAVNGVDLALWKAGFGSAVSAATNVPEPSSLALVLACAALASRRRRK